MVRKKDTALVKEAFGRIPYPLTDVKLFHADHGKKFDNQSIDDILNGFGITRSLSKRGFPYDNAVAESTYKFVKVEFVHQYQFKTLAQLRLELFDYVHWWNYLRLHGTLGMKHRYNFDNRDWQSEPLIMSSGLISLERQRN